MGQRVQVHRRPGQKAPYDIVSFGADGKEGGEGAEQGHHELAAVDAHAGALGFAGIDDRTSRARGVTLLELLVVLAIMALDRGARRSRRSAAACRRAELRSRRRASSRPGFASRAAKRSRSGARRSSSLDLEGRRFKVDRDPREYALPRSVELKLFTAQKDLVDEKIGAIRFYPDGGSNGGRITVASGERKFEVDVDWLTGRVAILD